MGIALHAKLEAVPGMRRAMPPEILNLKPVFNIDCQKKIRHMNDNSASLALQILQEASRGGLFIVPAASLTDAAKPGKRRATATLTAYFSGYGPGVMSRLKITRFSL